MLRGSELLRNSPSKKRGLEGQKRESCRTDGILFIVWLAAGNLKALFETTITCLG